MRLHSVNAEIDTLMGLAESRGQPMSQVQSIAILTVLLLLLLPRESSAKEEGLVVKMYKLACENVNYSYIARNFSCRLKAVNRHQSFANLYGWLVKRLKHLTIHMQLFKYYSQFRPFLFNVTVDYCELMKGKAVTSFYINLFVRNIMNTTNVVHECPFDGYIYAKDMWLDARVIRAPFPLGRYLLMVRFYDMYPESQLGQILYYADVYTRRPGGSNTSTKTRPQEGDAKPGPAATKTPNAF